MKIFEKSNYMKIFTGKIYFSRTLFSFFSRTVHYFHRHSFDFFHGQKKNSREKKIVLFTIDPLMTQIFLIIVDPLITQVVYLPSNRWSPRWFYSLLIRWSLRWFFHRISIDQNMVVRCQYKSKFFKNIWPRRNRKSYIFMGRW